MFGLNPQQLADLTRQNPLGLRLITEETLLGDWAEAYDRGSPDATRMMSIMQAIAMALHDVSSDRTVEECVAHASAGSADVREAYRAYRDARTAYNQATSESSRQAMLDAARKLQDVKSPLAARAWMYVATISHYLGYNKEAVQLVVRIYDALGDGRARYPVVAGQLQWTLGLCNYALGYHDEALRAYAEAARWLNETNEPANVAGIESVLSTEFRYLGEFDEAWSHDLRGLGRVNGQVSYERAQIALDGAARTAYRLGCLATCELFENDTLRRAKQRNDSVFAANAYCSRREACSRRCCNVGKSPTIWHAGAPDCRPGIAAR